MTFRLEIDGRDVEVAADHRDSGDDLVLFLHGLGCDRTTFRGAFDHDAWRDVSLLAPDLPGFGDSHLPDDFSVSMEAYARVCEGLLRHVPHRRLHVVAHSMGGAVALLLPEARRHGASSFACVEGNLVSEDCGLASREAAGIPFDTFVTAWFPDLRHRLAAAEGRYLALDRSAPAAFHAGAVSLVAWSDGGDLLRRFREQPGRVAYVHGSRNRALAVLDRIRGVALIEIPDSGHFAMIDQAEAFHAAVAAFCLRERPGVR